MMFKAPKLAKLMKWHADNHILDRKMWAMVDKEH
jgi:hypothetical protein